MGEHAVKQAREYAIHVHSSANHLYHGKPYEQHLHFVFILARHFLNIIGDRHQNVVLSAAWCHALMPRQSYRDIKDNTNLLTAEIVYALHEEKGRTRPERYNEKYFNELLKVPYAPYLKLCDTLADAHYAAKTKSPMLRVYQSEHANLRHFLYLDRYKQMFDTFDKIYNEQTIKALKA
jgi:hypothetical protein